MAQATPARPMNHHAHRRLPARRRPARAAARTVAAANAVTPQLSNQLVGALVGARAMSTAKLRLTATTVATAPSRATSRRVDESTTTTLTFRRHRVVTDLYQPVRGHMTIPNAEPLETKPLEDGSASRTRARPAGVTR